MSPNPSEAAPPPAAAPVGAALFVDRPPPQQGPSVVANENLDAPPDLTDPAVLRRLGTDIADGLDSEAMAADARTGRSGHPRPAFFFGRCAEIVRALVAKLPPPEPDAPTDNRKKK